MPAIELKVNTSQAKSNVDSLAQSMDGYIGRIKQLSQEGNYSEVADVISQMNKTSSQAMLDNFKQGNSPLMSNFQNGQTVRKLDMQLEILNGAINNLTQQLEENTKQGEYKNVSNISMSLNNLEQEKRRLEIERENLQKKENEDNKGLNKYFGMKEITQALNTFFQGFNINSNYRKDIANGNYLEAEINYSRSIGNTIGGSVSSFGNTLMLIPGARAAGVALSAGGSLVSGISNAIASADEADLAEASVYENAIKLGSKFNKQYSNGTYFENSKNSLADFILAREIANDTGLDINTFLQSQIMAGRYGYTNKVDASVMTQQAALYSQRTGTDINTVQNLLGTLKRYVNENLDVTYLSKARESMGLTRGQDEEFLNSLQAIITDGISEGYKKSTEEVASTFAMFNKLSNQNPFWQGEQGLKRLRQMDAGVESAISLNSTSDMIVFQAAKDTLDKLGAEKLLGKENVTGTYQDVFMLMEKGINPEMFSSIVENVKKLEGDNVAGAMEWFKQIFNVNTAGAYEIYKMSMQDFDANKLKEDIKKLSGDKQYKDATTEKQNYLNDIQASVAQIGQSKFWDTLKELEKIAKEYKNKNEQVKAIETEATKIIAENATSIQSKEMAQAQAQVTEANRNTSMDGDGTQGEAVYYTSVAAETLKNSGDYKGAIDTLLTWDKVSSNFSSDFLYSPQGGIYDHFVTKLAYPQTGNDQKDEYIKKRIAKYGEEGSLSFSKDFETNFIELIQKMNTNNNFRRAYDNTGKDSDMYFIAILEKMLREIFGEITVENNS